MQFSWPVLSQGTSPRVCGYMLRRTMVVLRLYRSTNVVITSCHPDPIQVLLVERLQATSETGLRWILRLSCRNQDTTRPIVDGEVLIWMLNVLHSYPLAFPRSKPKLLNSNHVRNHEQIFPLQHAVEIRNRALSWGVVEDKVFGGVLQQFTFLVRARFFIARSRFCLNLCNP